MPVLEGSGIRLHLAAQPHAIHARAELHAIEPRDTRRVRVDRRRIIRRRRERRPRRRRHCVLIHLPEARAGIANLRPGQRKAAAQHNSEPGNAARQLSGGIALWSLAHSAHE